MGEREEVFVLTADVLKEDGIDVDYTNVCGVTRDAKVAEAWAAGDGHSARLMDLGVIKKSGYDAAEFAE